LNSPGVALVFLGQNMPPFLQKCQKDSSFKAKIKKKLEKQSCIKVFKSAKTKHKKMGFREAKIKPITI